MTLPFANRAAAGQALAQRLKRMALSAPLVVLALPRGGARVAAVVEGGPPDIVLNDEAVSLEGGSRAYIEDEAKREVQEIARLREVCEKSEPPM